MATVSRETAEDLMNHGGRMAKDQEDAPDNPRAQRIVEYTDMGGNLAYGVVFDGDRDPYRYEDVSEYVRAPRVIWTFAEGRIP